MAVTSDARRAFLEGLIDYAGLFPPASLSPDEAVAEYRRAREGPHAWMLGRFVAPVSRLEELAPHLERGWGLAVIADLDLEEAVDRAAQSEAVELFELRLPDPDRAKETARTVADLVERRLAGCRTFLEVPVTSDWGLHVRPALEAMAEAGVGAKLRCGGVGLAGLPTPRHLSRLLHAARRLGLPLKATAGLHHPFRHFDPMEQLMQHGFVNLVGAAVLAHARSLGEEELEALVAERDKEAFSLTGESFAWRGLQTGAEEIAAARRELLVGFGSCSFSEPVEDLADWGVLS